MQKLEILNEQEIEVLKSWCVNRQTNGFNGRANKPSDSCYSFWIGSTLKVNFYLNQNKYLFKSNLRSFLIPWNIQIIRKI